MLNPESGKRKAENGEFTRYFYLHDGTRKVNFGEMSFCFPLSVDTDTPSKCLRLLTFGTDLTA